MCRGYALRDIQAESNTACLAAPGQKPLEHVRHDIVCQARPFIDYLDARVDSVTCVLTRNEHAYWRIFGRVLDCVRQQIVDALSDTHRISRHGQHLCSWFDDDLMLSCRE